MILKFLFIILNTYVIIRTIAYGIYSIKKTGPFSGISVFALGVGAIFTGYMILFNNNCIG